MRTWPLLLLVGALPFSLLAACGGGGGGAPEAPVRPVQMVGPTPSRTGTVQSDGVTFVGASRMAAGDRAGDVSSRIFLSFPLVAFPDAEQIESVRYVDEQTGVEGAPYASLGPLVVRSTNLGPVLDASDFAGPAFSLALGTLSTGAAYGARTLDLTDHVLALLQAGADRVDLMILFETMTDGDGVPDLVRLSEADLDDMSGYLAITRRPATE